MAEIHNRVLLVDDEPAILRAYTKVLSSNGWSVQTAANGREAIERLQRERFDVIISDVTMPEMTGLEFLRAVRERDLDVPVILMTGAPGLDSAMHAVEYGAFRYLPKPIEMHDLCDAVRRAARLHAMALLKREALEVVGAERHRLGDRAGLEARFAMAVRLLYMSYQPIVSIRDRRIFGYEALVRSTDPTLPTPGELLDAAERLGQVHELGRAIRARVAEDVARAPEGVKVFVNLHALDLNDETLYAPDSSFAKIAPKVVLEITERSSLEGVTEVEARVKELRGIGFQVAVDDLGAGYAGLTSYSQLEPDVAKIDLSLVRGIDVQPRKRSIVRSMKRLCDELGTLVVAEGVETAAERDALAEIGCDLLQGYYFARPAREFATLSL